MAKLWAGRSSGETAAIADDFNSSIRFDCRMYEQDIRGSMAHALMLANQNIISKEDADSIIENLECILNEIRSGDLQIDEKAEDIHMFIEQILTQRIGDAGKRLHTARSRNDQVALDLRMYLKDEIDEISSKVKNLISVITDKAEENIDTIMPGYTHLQRAQPISFCHQLMCYSMMFMRDIDRLSDCKKRMNVSPIGSCALAGTSYDTDRKFEADYLGFDSVCLNSIDGVSDRDFCIETISCLSILMMHLSRFSEEIILWTSSEFSFIELSDSYTTGSSIMPQKKNSDMAELCRGKTGRVYGDLITILTVMKGLPLAYNKDMQEDKEPVFDACDTVKMCLDVFSGMLDTMKVNKENMFNAAGKGFINATDLADYLVNKGLPFRSAYKISGALVRECIELGTVLEKLPLENYNKFSELFDDDIYDAINLKNCVDKRTSEGGTSRASCENQINFVRNFLSSK